ncbi:hypothetical protein BU17DRAFT_87677 [Hysterangium stoloniferum]|nr:hypothetical protein BU17DRAFT_87677 [Hysterangium stoloniferum]
MRGHWDHRDRPLALTSSYHVDHADASQPLLDVSAGRIHMSPHGLPRPTLLRPTSPLPTHGREFASTFLVSHDAALRCRIHGLAGAGGTLGRRRVPPTQRRPSLVLLQVTLFHSDDAYSRFRHRQPLPVPGDSALRHRTWFVTFDLAAGAVNDVPPLGQVSQTTVNFLDGINKVINGPLAYWGSNLPLLQQIKATIDPTDVFHNPQSVRPV